MTYEDDFKTAVGNKVILKSNLINASSSTPSTDKVMSEALVHSVLDSKIGEIDDYLGGS